MERNSIQLWQPSTLANVLHVMSHWSWRDPSNSNTQRAYLQSVARFCLLRKYCLTCQIDITLNREEHSVFWVLRWTLKWNCVFYFHVAQYFLRQLCQAVMTDTLFFTVALLMHHLVLQWHPGALGANWCDQFFEACLEDWSHLGHSVYLQGPLNGAELAHVSTYVSPIECIACSSCWEVICD